MSTLVFDNLSMMKNSTSALKQPVDARQFFNSTNPIGCFTKIANEWKNGTNTDFNIANGLIATLKATNIISTNIECTNINASSAAANTIGTAGKTVFYGDGSNLTGISAAGGGGVGIEVIHLFNEIGKMRNSYINTSSRSIIQEHFGTNLYVKNYRVQSGSGTSVVLNSTDVGIYGHPSAGESYRLVESSSGNYEDIIVSSYNEVSYTITTVDALTYTYDSSDYCYAESGVRASAMFFTFRTNTNDAHSKNVVYRGQLRDVGSKTNATITGQIVYNTNFQFRVETVNAISGQITLTSTLDMSTYISTASPNNKIFLQKVMKTASGEITPLNNGREYAVLGSSYGSPTITVTVDSSYYDCDTGTTKTDGLSDVTAPSANGNIYWVCVRKAIIPKYSFVSSGSNESYQNSTIKAIQVKNRAIPYPPYVHSHWKMDELTGNLKNARQPSGLYDMTQVGTVPYTQGKLGGARGAYSTSNYFYVSGSGGASVYSSGINFLEAWVKTGSTANQFIVGRRNLPSPNPVGHYLGIINSNLFYDITGVASVSVPISSIGLADNNWHYVFGANIGAGTNNKRLYVDGVLVAQGAGTTGYNVPSTGNEPLCIGVYVSGTSSVVDPWQGQIDSVAVGNTLPSSWDEIEQIIALRWNNGLGMEYGYDYGTTVITEEKNKSGQLFRPQIELVRNNVNSIDSIESAGWIIQ